MYFLLYCFTFLFCVEMTCFGQTAQSTNEPQKQVTSVCKEKWFDEAVVTTSHVIEAKGLSIKYDAVVGNIPIGESDGNPKASMFYCAYFRKNEKATRPLVFCFNGGPASSAIWLHMGGVGPKRVVTRDLSPNIPPGTYEDNPYTLLEVADLVFIDPIMTGFSTVAPGVDPKPYFTVTEDVSTFSEFIRYFLTKFDRWKSPRFIAGESYGTVRAVLLAEKLQQESYLDVNGIILISPVLDFQAYEYNRGNYLPYILSLPTYAACAKYQNKLSDQYQKMPLDTFLKEVEQFALDEYAPALLHGKTLENEKKKLIISKLCMYTGLTKDFIDDASLKLKFDYFAKELLKQKRDIVGRFDGRYKAFDPYILSFRPSFDPSFSFISSTFHSAFRDYVQNDLRWKKEAPYIIISHTAFSEWNFGLNKDDGGLGFLTVCPQLAQTMMRNPKMNVLFASGYYDLAAPYFASNYIVNQLPMGTSIEQNIVQAYYKAGHTFYLEDESLKKMNDDFKRFIIQSSKTN